MSVPEPPNARRVRREHGSSKSADVSSPVVEDALPEDHSVAFLFLVWIALASVRFLAALPIRQPQVMTDELAYWQMALSFHQSGSFLFHGKPYDVPAVLYSIALSPLFAFRDLPLVFDLARLVNGFLLSSVVFPAYGLAKEFVKPRIALFVAALAGLAPGASYSGLILAENLYYPLFCLSFWLAYRTLERGKWLDGGLAAGAFVLAYFTKPHLLLLAASYGIAVVFHTIDRLVHKEEPRELLLRLGARLTPLAGIILAGAIRFGLRGGLGGTRRVTLLLGGDAYAGELALPVGLSSPIRIAAVATALALTLSLAVIFIPTAKLIASLVRFRRLPDSLRSLLILSTSAVLVHVAVITRHTISHDTAPRMHERYLFVLSPALFLLPYALRRARWLTRVPASLLVVGFTVWLIGWHRLALSWNTPSDSPSLTGLFLLSRQSPRVVLIVVVSTIVFGVLALGAGWRRGRETRIFAGLALSLLLLNAGWYAEVYEAGNDLRAKNFARTVGERVRPGSTLAVITDRLDPHVIWALEFWLPNRLLLFTVSEQKEEWWIDAIVPPADLLSSGSYILAASSLDEFFAGRAQLVVREPRLPTPASLYAASR